MIFFDADPTVEFYVGVAAEYVDRGISLSSSKPVAFGGADADFEGFYVGVWGATVDFTDFGDDETDIELSIYAGRRLTLAGIDLDVGFAHNVYGGQPADAQLNFSEFQVLATRSYGPLALEATLAYSPNFTADSGEAWYSEISIVRQLSGPWAIYSGVGRQQIETGGNYNTWNGGLTWTLDTLSIDARFSDTDQRELGSAYGSRLSITLEVAF